tara:strand:- start:299 stop:1126 length:828 start_codon:yes stop_codon:yes gene_type:complete
MIKTIFFGMICFVILFSVNVVYAQEELPLPEGKNIREWESISAALMQEKRYDDAVIYLDKIIEHDPDNLRALSNKAGVLIHLNKYEQSLQISDHILDIDPNRISTLQNKGVAQKMLKNYEESYESFNRVLELEPENKQAAISIARTLGLMETISTLDSPYTIHGQFVIRDSGDNLIGVIESYNSRYLPSEFFEEWWKGAIGKGLVVFENGLEKLEISGKHIQSEDHTGMFSWETSVNGNQELLVLIFQIFIPMVEVSVNSDFIEQKITIIKNPTF